MELAYIAHSERCALLLDRDGICRWAVPKVDATDDVVVAAKRCIGAQFLASLDPDAPGFMTSEPRIGRNLLFAMITDGRVALLRFGPLQAFERLDPPESAISEPAKDAVAPTPAAAPVATPPEPRADEEERPVEAPPTAIAPAEIETAADVTLSDDDATADGEQDALPPTVAKVPELDDMLASFAEEPIEVDLEPKAIDASDGEADVDDITLSPNEPREADSTLKDGHDEDDVTLSRAAPSVNEPVVPPALDSSDAIATMAFERDEKSDLDALLANAARPQTIRGLPRAMPRSLDDGLQESLDRITLLTNADIEELDDSQLDVITNAFSRSGVPLPAPVAVILHQERALESELELEVDTSDMIEPDERVVARNPLANRNDAAEPSLRPSGFVRRAMGTDPEIDEVSTHRFARAAGDEADLAPPAPPADLFDLGRRGMLPRR